MRKRELTDFGKRVKMELILRGKPQKWLEQEVKKQTGYFVDSSIMCKILTGQVHSETIESSIQKVLNLTRL